MSAKGPGEQRGLPSRVVVRRKRQFLDLRLVYFTGLVIAATLWLSYRPVGVASAKRSVAISAKSHQETWMRDHAAELAAKGLWNEAVAAYELALREEDLSPSTRANLHFRVAEICRERLGRYEKAIDHYLRVKRCDPASPRVIETGKLIVAAFDALGREGDAQRTLDRITALKPMKATQGDPVVARVGKRSFTLRDVDEGIRVLPAELQKRFAGVEGRRAFLQEQLMGPELLAMAAKRARLDRKPELRRRLDSLERQVLGQAYLQRELASLPAPTEADLELFHKANADKYKGTPPSKGSTEPVALLPLKACRDKVQRDWQIWKRDHAVKEIFQRLGQAQDVSLNLDAFEKEGAGK